MNSVEITRYMYKKGYITKEAALRILKTRKELVKEATEKMANEIFFEKKAEEFPYGTDMPTPGPKPPKGKALGFGRAAKGILPLLGIAGLVTIGSTGAKIGLGALSDIKLNEEVKKSYNKMFNEYPELKEEKPKATKFFNMMARFSPVLASNPIIAGTWVKGTMDRNLVSAPDIKQLIDAQKIWEETRSMKSPLVGISKELPETKSIFDKAINLGLTTD